MFYSIFNFNMPAAITWGMKHFCKGSVSHVTVTWGDEDYDDGLSYNSGGGVWQ